MVSDITRDKLTFEAFKKRYLDVLSGNHDFEEDLISFRLMQEDGQMTNAGVLFADQWNIHHSRMFCTRWNGLDKAGSVQDALDDLEITGSLLSLFDNAMDFVRKNSKKGWRKDKDKRVELPDYPERAVEEGLVNALIHRSYLQTGAHSQIDIYDESEIMGKSRRSIQMIMKELIDSGTVERVGSKKVGTWIVK